jgi:hypothetical protein
LKLGERIEIGLNLGIAVIGHLPAPGPQGEIEPAYIEYAAGVIDSVAALPILFRRDLGVAWIIVAVVDT